VKAAAGAVLAGYGALYAGVLFFAVRWEYPTVVLWALGLLAVLGTAVIGRLLRTAGRPERRWFRGERPVCLRLLHFLYAAAVPFAMVEVLDGDRPDWDRLVLGAVLVTAIAMNSGYSWRDEDRVRELLPEGERLKVAVPVRWGRTPFWRRAVHGRFLVFTDRRVLLFAYDRFLDLPFTRPLWSEPAEDLTAELRVADRRLLLHAARPSARAAAGEREFKVAAVRKADLERYAAGTARV
jgi:hypothetical protein